MGRLKDTLVKVLEKTAYLKAYESSCFFAWGEVEMPVCLQQESEKNHMPDQQS